MKAIGEWFNKDVYQALMVIVAALVIGLLAISVSGCTVTEAYRPRLEAGLAVELDRSKPVVGRDPVGVARVVQPLYVHPSGFRVIGEYLHLSSIPDVHDSNTVDQAGILFSVPLGRRIEPISPVCRPGT